MKAKYQILILFLFFTANAFCQDNTESKTGKIMDSLETLMFPKNIQDDFIPDSAIKYCKIGLAIDKKAAIGKFFDGRLVVYYNDDKQWDSVLKYGPLYLKRNIKMGECELKHDFFMAKNMQREICEDIFTVDTTRHKYKEALKYEFMERKKYKFYGSGTGENNRIALYYNDLISCYKAMGNQKLVNRYKKKLENHGYMQY